MHPCYSGQLEESTNRLRQEFIDKRRQFVTQLWTRYVCLTVLVGATIGMMSVNQSLSPLVTYIFFSTVIIYVCVKNGQCCSHHPLASESGDTPVEGCHQPIAFIVVENASKHHPTATLHTSHYPFNSLFCKPQTNHPFSCLH